MPIVLSGQEQETEAVALSPESPEEDVILEAEEAVEPEVDPEPEPEPTGEVEDDAPPIDPVADHEEEIADLSAQVATAAVYLSKSQAETKSAKKRFDAAVEDLRHIIDRGPKEMPLFDKQPREVDLTGPEPDLSWESRSIDELSLPDRITNKLGVETIGQLEDLRKDISLGKAKWPKGIGPTAITKIEDAVLDWLRDNGPRPTE